VEKSVVPKGLDVEFLADLEEAAHHLVAVGVVRREERNLLAEFREGIATDRTRRHVRVQRFVECVFAEVRGLVDGVGLADRIEDDATFLGDVVDRELNRRR
jgi:hypothetical protein